MAMLTREAIRKIIVDMLDPDKITAENRKEFHNDVAAAAGKPELSGDEKQYADDALRAFINKARGN